MISTLILMLATGSQEVPLDLSGTYYSEEMDIRVLLIGSGYEVQIGRPVSLPRGKRHVDFESGHASMREGRVVLTCSSLFKSPTRLPLLGYFGWGLQPRYKVILTSDAQRLKFENELSWRKASSGPTRTIVRVRRAGKTALSMDGNILLRLPDPKPQKPSIFQDTHLATVRNTPE